MKRLSFLFVAFLALVSPSCSKEDAISRTEDLCSSFYWKVTGPESITKGQDVYVSFFSFEDDGYGVIRYIPDGARTSVKDNTLYVDGDFSSENFRFFIVQNTLSIQKSGGTSYVNAEVTCDGDRVTVNCDATPFFKKKPVLKRSSIEYIAKAE